MAATDSSTNRDAPELKLAAEAPEVTYSAAGDRFTVTFALEGVDLLQLENALKPRLAEVGVEKISRFGMTMSLHGVEEGREGEVFHEVESVIHDVNDLRAAAREQGERDRCGAETAANVVQSRVERVAMAFQTASERHRL